jgi:hypothetical protein
MSSLDLEIINFHNKHTKKVEATIKKSYKSGWIVFTLEHVKLGLGDHKLSKQTYKKGWSYYKKNPTNQDELSLLHLQKKKGKVQWYLIRNF